MITVQLKCEDCNSGFTCSPEDGWLREDDDCPICLGRETLKDTEIRVFINHLSATKYVEMRVKEEKKAPEARTMCINCSSLFEYDPVEEGGDESCPFCGEPESVVNFAYIFKNDSEAADAKLDITRSQNLKAVKAIIADKILTEEDRKALIHLLTIG